MFLRLRSRAWRPPSECQKPAVLVAVAAPWSLGAGTVGGLCPTEFNLAPNSSSLHPQLLGGDPSDLGMPRLIGVSFWPGSLQSPIGCGAGAGGAICAGRLASRSSSQPRQGLEAEVAPLALGHTLVTKPQGTVRTPRLRCRPALLPHMAHAGAGSLMLPDAAVTPQGGGNGGSASGLLGPPPRLLVARFKLSFPHEKPHPRVRQLSVSSERSKLRGARGLPQTHKWCQSEIDGLRSLPPSVQFTGTPTVSLHSSPRGSLLLLVLFLSFFFNIF